IGLELAIAAGAVYGGVGLVRDGMGMPVEWLAPTPFDSWRWPGYSSCSRCSSVPGCSLRLWRTGHTAATRDHANRDVGNRRDGDEPPIADARWAALPPEALDVPRRPSERGGPALEPHRGVAARNRVPRSAELGDAGGARPAKRARDQLSLGGRRP